jgi:pimeloyl-ACP methyl ester carboxylesterase
MSHLIVLPGLSSPNHEKYYAAYGLLREEAAKRKTAITIVEYPGQISATGAFIGHLSPESAVGRALELLADLEARNECYRTLGISFGCFVSLAAASRSKKKDGWGKMVLWGPIPFWRTWRAFGRGIRDESLGNGSRFVDPLGEFYRQMLPNEHLLGQVKVPSIVGVGSRDKYVEREYLHYLARLCDGGECGHHTFAYVQGCSHNVSKEDPNWMAYVELVFS